MGNLGVQLVLFSRSGVVAPIAASRDRDLVERVGKHILQRWRNRKFDDEVLDLLAREETNRLAKILESEGLEFCNDFAS